MNDHLNLLFLDNPELVEQIEAFCTQNPEYRKVQQEFYEAAEELAKIVGYDRYDRFERSMGIYLARSNDLYYLFGLGLRQDILSALQPEMS